MLKKVIFNGIIYVDAINDGPFYIEHLIKEGINDGGIGLEIDKMDIINESDIEKEWKNAIPYGTRNDDKTCLEIFKEELESKKTQEEIEHPAQKKFEFVKEN